MADVSFMQYMRAHGNTPGPTQRPYLTGAVSGLIASVPSGAVLYWSGALSAAVESFGTEHLTILAFDTVFVVLAGMLYAAVFKRAANDRQGGWLFGMSYGFLLWTLSPLTLWQLASSNPGITGRAAMGLFGGQILYGLALGFFYPHIHRLLQSSLNERENGRAGQEFGNRSRDQKEIKDAESGNRRDSAHQGKTPFARKSSGTG